MAKEKRVAWVEWGCGCDGGGGVRVQGRRGWWWVEVQVSVVCSPGPPGLKGKESDAETQSSEAGGALLATRR